MEKFDLEDRPIVGVGWSEDPDYHWVRLGVDDINRISHRELFCGEYSIHWIEIWKEGRVIARYNARNVDCILYEDF